jgi:tRNA A-37 threonylcarbamoyl transferase component Bud32
MLIFCQKLLQKEKIFHGDIKPLNTILINGKNDNEYLIRFIDFGGSSIGVE